MVSFRVRKASTLACSRWEAWVSFSSSPCSCAYCACRSASWLCDADRRVQRLAGQVLAAGRQRVPGLPLELVRGLLELC